MGIAFDITPDDVANVLRKNWSRVGNARGMSFDALGEQLHNDLDLDAVEESALNGGDDLDDQTVAAYTEIERQLVENGTLEPVKLRDRPSP